MYVIGVDVGTGSARAAVFDAHGALLASAVEAIEIWHPEADHVEQSSADIWRAVTKVVRACRKQSRLRPEQVVGIGFDATCSLVVLDRAGEPLPVNRKGDAQRNVIVWMDHRALAETEAINAGGHEVLRYVGGRLSPEMEIPKLRWLKTQLPATWAAAGKFFDLADFLVYRATDIDCRSLCTLVCKWTYLGHEGKHGRWDRAFLKRIGLGDVLAHDKVGSNVRPLGTRVGQLSPRAAEELGLTTDAAVSVGIIDAHAGGLGLLGALTTPSDGRRGAGVEAFESGLALIGGTSNCHMAVSVEPRFIDGVWGPYFGAMVPGYWLTEGGQSAAGSAIDHTIADHAASTELRATSRREKTTVYELLNRAIARLQADHGCGPELTRHVHVLPDFIGNRSPLADPQVRGLIDGLTLADSLDDLAVRYYATVQAVAYGTRAIVARLNRSGYRIRKLLVTGGSTKNPLWLQEHADATQCTLVLPREPEAVLLGSAILGAAAAGVHADVITAMRAMTGTGGTIEPRRATAAFHAAKFQCFERLYVEQRKRRALMMNV